MTIPNELSDIMIAVIGGYVASVMTILGGGWALINRLLENINNRQDVLDDGLKERQESFMAMMSQHIRNEEREFTAQATTQAEVKKKLERFELEYVTKADLDRQLAPLRRDAAETRRIVDARVASGADPVSGRPAADRRRESRSD